MKQNLTQNRTLSILPILAYISVSFSWGTTYLAIKIAVTVFPPGLFAGIRFLIAGAILLLFARIKNIKFPDNYKQYLKNAFPGILIICGSNGIVMYISKWVDSGIISVFIASIPLFIALLETVDRRENVLRLSGWFGLIMSFIGVVFIARAGSDIGNIDLKGIVWVMIAVIMGAVGSVSSRKMTSGPVVVTAGIQMFTAGLIMFIIGTLLGEFSQVSISSKAVWAMLYLIFIGSLMGYGCFVYLLSIWSPTRVSTISYVNTVIALLLGVIILKESISLTSVISTFVILLGVIVVQASKKTVKK
jgi:drug/metabolite transporter (DMT)-like permease